MFDSGATKKCNAMLEVIETSQLGIIKRIDENRELLEFLYRNAYQLVDENPWVTGWIKSQDRFLNELAAAANVSSEAPSTGFRRYPRPWPERPVRTELDQADAKTTTATPATGSAGTTPAADDGIMTDSNAAPFWVRVIPRVQGKLPNTNDGRHWQWLRLDTITEIYSELAIGGFGSSEDRYKITVAAAGQLYHPSELLLEGNVADEAVRKLMDLVNAATRHVPGQTCEERDRHAGTER